MAPTLHNGLPSLPGTYAIVLFLDDRRDLTIGRLGHFDFPPGHYVYIGSALGPGGLNARARHHLAPARSARWHIDYLLRLATPVALHTAVGTERREWAWSRIINALPGANVIAPGFGASDCRCISHLVYFADAMGVDILQTVLLPGRHDLVARLRQCASVGDDDTCDTLTLALSAENDTRSELASLLEDPNRDVRWWAVRALSVLRDPAASDPLVVALGDIDEAVRVAAAWALGERRSAVAVDSLVKRLADPSGWVRRTAAEALRLIGEPAIPALTAALEDTRDGVRVQVAYALSRLRTVYAIPALFAALDDPNYLVHAYALGALEAMGMIGELLII
jgi:Uri superfamily endonuclease